MKSFTIGFYKRAGLAEVATVAVFQGTKMLWGRRRDNGRETTPGGHLEPGENPLEGAKRELFEEAGIRATNLKHLKTEQVTTPKGKRLIIHGYQFTCPTGTATTMKDDPDQEVTRWRWVETKDGLPKEVAENLHSPKNVLLKALGMQPTEKTASEGGLMNTFWQSFEKRAATKPPAPKGMQASNRMAKWDAQGGLAPRTPEEMGAAQQADVITLPKGIEGVNCANCQNVRPIDKQMGFCTLLKMDVTSRMVCSQWNAPGVLRNFEQVEQDAAQVTPEEKAQQAQQQELEQQALAQQDADQRQQADLEPRLENAKPKEKGKPAKDKTAPAAAKPKEKKPTEKESTKTKAGGHEININLGEKK